MHRISSPRFPRQGCGIALGSARYIEGNNNCGWVLNCQPHDIPALIHSHLLKPLGNPPPNGIKFFATAEVLELVNDRSWLAKITNTINQHWRKKNDRQKGHSSNGAHNGRSHALDLAELPGEH